MQGRPGGGVAAEVGEDGAWPHGRVGTEDL